MKYRLKRTQDYITKQAPRSIGKINIPAHQSIPKYIDIEINGNKYSIPKLKQKGLTEYLFEGKIYELWGYEYIVEAYEE